MSPLELAGLHDSLPFSSGGGPSGACGGEAGSSQGVRGPCSPGTCPCPWPTARVVRAPGCRPSKGRGWLSEGERRQGAKRPCLMATQRQAVPSSPAGGLWGTARDAGPGEREDFGGEGSSFAVPQSWVSSGGSAGWQGSKHSRVPLELKGFFICELLLPWHQQWP